jgi:hypothetical protein
VEERNKIFLDLIKTSSSALGHTATPTLAACAEHLMGLLTKGTNGAGFFKTKDIPVAKEPVVTLPTRVVTTKSPLEDELLSLLVQLQSSGNFVRTCRRHQVGVNSVKNAIAEKRATAEMTDKLWHIVNNEVSPDEPKKVVPSEIVFGDENNPALNDVIQAERSFTEGLCEE